MPDGVRRLCAVAGGDCGSGGVAVHQVLGDEKTLFEVQAHSQFSTLNDSYPSDEWQGVSRENQGYADRGQRVFLGPLHVKEHTGHQESAGAHRGRDGHVQDSCERVQRQGPDERHGQDREQEYPYDLREAPGKDLGLCASFSAPF